MKKIICILLVFTFLFSTITITAQSAGSEQLGYIDPTEYQRLVYASPTPDVFANYSDETIDTITQKIRSAINNAQTEVAVNQYYLTVEALSGIISDLYYSCAETFLNEDFNIYYYYSGNYVTRVIIEYTTSTSTFLAKKSKYFNEINRIISLMDEDFTDLEKIVFIHDYIVKNYTYDTRVYSSTEYRNTIHDSFNFIFEKRGVCQAYASTFMFFMEQLGINCRVAVSSDHAWNIVEVENQFYHIDCTWDDPLNYSNFDFYGSVHHNNMLLSDDAIRLVDGENKSSHETWVEYPMHYTDAVCDEDKYENYFWKEINTPIVPYKDNWFSLQYNTSTRETSILSCDDTFTQLKNIYTMSDRWYASGNSGSFWPDFYSGLELIGDRLYFNTSKSACSFNLITNTFTKIKTFNITENIYSCLQSEEGIINFYTAPSPNDAISSVISYDVCGDIDGDGTITATDLVIFKKHLLEHLIMTSSIIDDYDSNGVTNIVDYIILKKYVVGLRDNLK